MGSVERRQCVVGWRYSETSAFGIADAESLAAGSGGELALPLAPLVDQFHGGVLRGGGDERAGLFHVSKELAANLP